MQKIKRMRIANKNDNRISSMVEHPSVGERIWNGIVVILVTLVALICLLPLWHVLMSSLSDGRALLGHEGLVLLPVGEATIEGYQKIFRDSSLFTGLANTVIYTVSATVLCYVLAVSAGYALSKPTKLQTPMVLIMTFTLLFGGGVVPTYMVLRNMGMIGTRWSLIIPGCCNSMFAILMMNAFKGVPKEYEESATIDGANQWIILTRVMLPQVQNMAMVVVINSVVGQWNSWFNASIYVTNQRGLWPLQLWVREMTSNNEAFLQSANPDYSRYLIQFALIMFATIPAIVLLPIFQDKLEKGVLVGGIKG